MVRGGDPARALFLLDVPVAQQRVKTADAGAERDEQTVGIDGGLVVQTQSRVCPGLERRDHGELRRAVELAGRDAVHHRGGVDGCLRGDPRGQFLCPCSLDDADAAGAGEKRRPRGGQVTAEGECLLQGR